MTETTNDLDCIKDCIVTLEDTVRELESIELKLAAKYNITNAPEVFDCDLCGEPVQPITGPGRMLGSLPIPSDTPVYTCHGCGETYTTTEEAVAIERGVALPMGVDIRNKLIELEKAQELDHGDELVRDWLQVYSRYLDWVEDE